MAYDLDQRLLPLLLSPIAQATEALVRLDERLASSPLGHGVLERQHFSDACASLWLDGELVHLEDLVLHEAGHDIRAPSHELTIARDVLRSRKRILTHPVEWPFTLEGLRTLRRGGSGEPELETKGWSDAASAGSLARQPASSAEAENPVEDAFARELAAFDALLDRSTAMIARVKEEPLRRGLEREPLVYDPQWDEEERMAEWLSLLQDTQHLPAVLQAVLLLDAWSEIGVFQHGAWLGRLLVAALLRRRHVTALSHLTALNLGLRAIRLDQRRHRSRSVRLTAMLEAVQTAAQLGLKDHDRLLLARQTMERRLTGRRSTSRMPELVDLVMTRPLVSAKMVAEVLDVTPRAALRILEDLGLRELTGRGRYRAWGIV
ncbi:RHE_PE00001 family protein [Rhizobium sp. SSA_523]|uniref:RHE_PE00001 family protein n=1 Tax=Rhizobium sp. SSA_523 TaxID=2952477 RepID=UPI0020905D99|nr:RHE_PE00001 family protein [Rhizobium sp. SSA_523]MCO5733246.1 RHE_PE00001 family protein [Rhizobium sp. SSA_523]WKC21768.1 RHE_PE00001 family protein [Rhizobium sp. SSA_523]